MNEEPEDEVKRVRQGAAVAFHEYRKALMPLAGTSEYAGLKIGELFRSLEMFAADLPEEQRARLLEIIEKPREQLPRLLESSAQKHRFLIESLEQLVVAAQPGTDEHPRDAVPDPNSSR